LINNKKMLEALGGKKVLSSTFEMVKHFIIGRKLYRNSTILILDQVGKQVRWLMYHLERDGFTDYYFLDKGAYGVLGVQIYNKK